MTTRRKLDDDDYIVRDGESVRVPTRFMDSRPPSRSGVRTPAQTADLNRAYRERDSAMRDAWKDPPLDETDPRVRAQLAARQIGRTDRTGDGARALADARADRDAHLRDAWKGDAA